MNSLSASQPRSKSSAKWLKFMVSLDSGASDSVFPSLLSESVQGLALSQASRAAQQPETTVLRALMSTSRALSLGHSMALRTDESYIKTRSKYRGAHLRGEGANPFSGAAQCVSLAEGRCKKERRSVAQGSVVGDNLNFPKEVPVDLCMGLGLSICQTWQENIELEQACVRPCEHRNPR